MDKMILNMEVTGCPNACFHCHCFGGVKNNAFMSVDEVVSLSSKFRDKINKNVEIYLLQEQTYYPEFFSMISALEENGFTRQEREKMLVTNCYGIANIDGFAEEVKEHFNLVKPTLFGIGQTHDMHGGRKGAFEDIVKGTKKCIELGINTAWEILLTKKNSKEINEIYVLGKELGVKQIFTSAEYMWTGTMMKNAEKYVPDIYTLNDVKNEIYEIKRLKTERDYIKELKAGKSYNVETVDLNQLYVDRNFNVYPFGNIYPEFLIGNLKNDIDEVIFKLINQEELPIKLIEKRKLSLYELALKYGDENSLQMHTPQSLFDKYSLMWQKQN